MSIEQEFLKLLQQACGRLDQAQGDGELHRFHIEGDQSGSQNGWYVLYLDSPASGAFGSWKTGEVITWCSKKVVDASEAAELRQRIEQVRHQRKAEREARQKSAAAYAQRIWSSSPAADPAHPYLVRKCIPALNLRQSDGALLVPLYSGGHLVNLQRINADGSKKFLYGGQIMGAYAVLGHLLKDEPMYIAEGWATAVTVYQITDGRPVAAAMTANNLKPVALALRAKYPDQQLIIAGDDDRMTDGNPGKTHALAAAVAVGGTVLMPRWPEGAPDNLTDFNDLNNWTVTHDAE